MAVHNYGAPTLESKLGTQMVTIFVGRKRKEFCVHRKLLCDASDFYAKAFNSQFREGVDGIMYLPEDAPGGFSLFVEWLYRGHLAEGNSDQHLQDLYSLYLLAEKNLQISLKDDTMDKIQDICAQHDKYVDIELVRKVYGRTPTSCVLRGFCLHLMVYQYSQDLEVRVQLLDGTEDQEEAREMISKDYIDNVRALVGGDVQFFDEFFEHFEIEFCHGQKTDPRVRDESVEQSRCLFHCHGPENPCREQKGWDEAGEMERSVAWIDGVEDDDDGWESEQ